MRKSCLACLLVVVLAASLPVSQACADEVDPGGKFAIGLRAQGGWGLHSSKGSVETALKGSGYEFDSPLGLRDFVLRYYSQGSYDLEFGFNIHHLSRSADNTGYGTDDDGQSITNIVLSAGVFSKRRAGETTWLRLGGRFNVDILKFDLGNDYIMGYRGKIDTEMTTSIEPAFSIEWFVTEHFSLMPEILMLIEFPNEQTNMDATSINTGFQLMVTVIP